MKLHSMKLIFGSANPDGSTLSIGSGGWTATKIPVAPGQYFVEITDPLSNSIPPVVTVTPFDPAASAAVNQVTPGGFQVFLKDGVNPIDGGFGFIFIQHDP